MEYRNRQGSIGQPETATHDDNSASKEPLARQFQEKGAFEFAASQFGALVGAAAELSFLNACEALNGLQKMQVLDTAEHDLPTGLKDHYCEEVADLLLHGDGEWGEQEALATVLGVDGVILSRLLERAAFGYVMVMFKALLKELPTGKATARKLDMFSPVVEQLIRNRAPFKIGRK